MKLPLSALCILIVLAACTARPGISITGTPSADLPTLPAISTPRPAPTETPVPPSPTPFPSAPPLPAVIEPETVGRLANSASFGYGELTRTLAFSPDGSILVSAGGNTDDFDIRIWQTASGELQHTLTGHTGIVWMVAFSPDGQLLVSVSSDATARIWDPRIGALLHTLEFPAEVISAAFSPDGETLAIGGVDGFPNAAIWTFRVDGWLGGLKLAEFWNIPAILFSPDGTRVAGGGTSRNARIWDAATGAELAVLFHTNQVSSLALSPDGTTIAAATCADPGGSGSCSEGAIWLWDLQTGGLLAKHYGFPNNIVRLAYSGDGKMLILGSRADGLKFYTVPDLAPILVETGSPSGNGVFALTADGRYIATIENDGAIHLWQVSP